MLLRLIIVITVSSRTGVFTSSALFNNSATRLDEWLKQQAVTAQLFNLRRKQLIKKKKIKVKKKYNYPN